MFEDALTVQHIASSLASFDAERTATKIQAWAAARDFDRVGVRKNGVVVGYADRRALGAGVLGNHCVSFADDDVISGDTHLVAALEHLEHRRAVFIRMLGEVQGVVTRGDVARPAVRLWLFGLITIAEMQLARIIRRCYPDEDWTAILGSDAVTKLRKQLKEKSLSDLNTDLVDCLYLSAKFRIVLATPHLPQQLGFAGQEDAKGVFGHIKDLRNKVAHADDLTSHWPGFLHTARRVDALIAAAEDLSGRDLRS